MLQLFDIGSALKGLLHSFSTCIEIAGNNWYCSNLKNVEKCKEKFQRVKKDIRNLYFN